MKDEIFHSYENDLRYLELKRLEKSLNRQFWIAAVLAVFWVAVGVYSIQKQFFGLLLACTPFRIGGAYDFWA